MSVVQLGKVYSKNVHLVCTLSRWFSILFEAVITGINHLELINVSGPHGLKLKIPVKSRSLFKVIVVGLWFY